MDMLMKKSARSLSDLQETDMDQIRQSELNSAQEEFFDLRNKMNRMVDNLTLVQFQKVVENMEDMIASFNMNQ